VIVVSLLLILVSGGLLAVGILQANDPFVMASIGVSVLAAAALFLGIRQQRPVDRPSSQDVPTRIERKPAAAGRVIPPGAATRATAPASPPPARAAVASASVGAAPVTQAAAGTPVTQTTAGAAPAAGKAAVRVPPPPVAEPADAGEVTETQIIDRNAVTQAEPAYVEPAPSEPEPPAAQPPAAEPLAAEPPAAAPAAEPAAAAAPTAAPAEESDVESDVESVQESGEESVELDDDEDPPDEPAAELLMASEASRLAAMENEVLVVDGRPRYHLSGCAHLADKESQPLPVSEAVELGFDACSLCGAATAILAEAAPR
jgi:hypothetical protein